MALVILRTRSISVLSLFPLSGFSCWQAINYVVPNLLSLLRERILGNEKIMANDFCFTILLFLNVVVDFGQSGIILAHDLMQKCLANSGSTFKGCFAFKLQRLRYNR